MANQTPAAGTDIVLVADDNASLRSKIGDYLAMEDIRSVEAGDGKMALAEAMRVHPSVVLLDIKMPALDGLSAAKLIVELPWRPKVILMSGFDDSVRLANKAGLPAIDVLEKTVPLRMLARFVWAALEGGAANRLR